MHQKQEVIPWTQRTVQYIFLHHVLTLQRSLRQTVLWRSILLYQGSDERVHQKVNPEQSVYQK